MQINKYNFLRWSTEEAEPTNLRPLVNGYIRDAGRCDYMPLLISGETMRFYINALDGLNDIIASPGTAKLKLVNSKTGQVVNADVATLNQDLFTTAEGVDVFTFYADVSITIAAGEYYFLIGDDVSNFLTSNFVKVPSDDYLKYSVLCKFRHDRYFYGVNYQNISDFYQQFRLHLNEIDTQYESDKDVYNEVTTGKQRTFNNYKKKTRKLEAYYFDRGAHDAAEIMFDSDEIFMNGFQYVTKGTYKQNPNPLAKLLKGEIDLYDEDFATANRCLQPFEDSGGGGTCRDVQLPDGLSLPTATAGAPYYFTFTLIGSLPIEMTVNSKPTWETGMDIAISGNVVTLSGTLASDDVGGTVNIDFTNCTEGTVNFTDTVSVIAATNNISVCTDHFTETIGRSIFAICKSSQPVPHDVQIYVTLHTEYNGGTQFENYTFTRIIYAGNSQSAGLKINYGTGYGDEHFIGAEITAFLPATDGIYTYVDGGLCS